MNWDYAFAPGESPFHTKGNVYRALFESADLRVPGGASAVLARIEDQRLRAFFDQHFLAASTYDILPLIPFGMIGATLAGVPYPEFVRRGAEFTAERDMHGIYKVLLKLASPVSVVQRLPRILVQYFDFGSVAGKFMDQEAYEATASSLPRPIVPWLMNVARGFVPNVMGRAGARNPQVLLGQAVREGERMGVDLMRVSFIVRWGR